MSFVINKEKRFCESQELALVVVRPELVLVRTVDQRRMVSSRMLRREALIRTDVSEELNASFIRATRIGELGKTN
jgi:hypothetical protein